MIRILLITAALFLLTSSTALAQILPDFRDVVYADFGTGAVRLDVYLPEAPGDEPIPLVVWVHGGAWANQTKRNIGPSLLLLEEGIAVASIDYRLTTQTQFNERTHPAQIHDVKAAVRFLRANAELFNIDPTRIGAWGSSAGGHLVSLLGTSGEIEGLEGQVGGNIEQASRVQAVADHYGPSNFWTIGGMHDNADSPESIMLDLWLGDIKANRDNPSPPYPELVARVDEASPVTHVSADDPPFFIAHGDNDTLVPWQQSAELAGQLINAGVEVEFHLVSDGGHNNRDMPSDLAVAFFIEQLVQRDPVRPGDTDMDNSVDDDDLSVFLGNWTGPGGSGSTWCEGDFTRDGANDDDDLSLLLANWDAAPTGVTIPEPATASLCVLAAVLPRRTRR